MYTVYGIKNCNTVKNALDWLKRNNVEFEFHDYKAKGIDPARLKNWSGQLGWEKLVNKKGTTWRQLDEKIQNKVTSEKTAIDLMLEKTSVIKRPLIEWKNKVVALGFDEVEYKTAFK
jgi:Spx/MgsR family transcriptional regulator